MLSKKAALSIRVDALADKDIKSDESAPMIGPSSSRVSVRRMVRLTDGAYSQIVNDVIEGKHQFVSLCCLGDEKSESEQLLS